MRANRVGDMVPPTGSLDGRGTLYALRRREAECARLRSAGMGWGEVAGRLGITPAQARRAAQRYYESRGYGRGRWRRDR